MSLLKKLLGKKEKPTSFSVEEITPFLKANGLDVETAGFPCIDLRNAHPLERYSCGFTGIKVTPVKISAKFEFPSLPAIPRIEGDYHTRASTAYQDEIYAWHPAPFGTKYHFVFENGELQLSKVRDIDYRNK